MGILGLHLVVDVLVLATDHHDLCLSSSDSQMRELGKVMLQNYCLDLVRGDLFCAVGLVQKDYHLLVLVVDFKAVVQLFHVEHSALTSPTLFVLADHYEWGEFEDVSNRS